MRCYRLVMSVIPGRREDSSPRYVSPRRPWRLFLLFLLKTVKTVKTAVSAQNLIKLLKRLKLLKEASLGPGQRCHRLVIAVLGREARCHRLVIARPWALRGVNNEAMTPSPSS